MEDLLTPKELASMLKVRVSTISMWARQNKIPHYVISAGRGSKRERRIVRFSMKDWMLMINNHGKTQSRRSMRL